MAEFYTPSITEVMINPNPADFNTALLISITIIDELIDLPAEIRYCGELYCGEE